MILYLQLSHCEQNLNNNKKFKSNLLNLYSMCGCRLYLYIDYDEKIIISLITLKKKLLSVHSVSLSQQIGFSQLDSQQNNG